MILAHTIDANGYMLEAVVVPDDTQNSATTIVTTCPDGFYKPQWLNGTWQEGLDSATLLSNAKTARLAYLNVSFDKAIAQGFSSSASGTATTYAIDPVAMGKWTGTLANINDGMLTTNIMVKDINGNKVTLTPTQFKQFAMDGFTFFNNQEQNLWTKEDDVENATTVDAVNAITF